MHPWMDPEKVVLWPHGTHQVYDAFDRIFSCKGHGWANLQSMHINLPFAGDEEFARLHSAIRFLLPILPGLAASSPIIDGLPNGILDNRLLVYRDNCARIPSVTGAVVPEVVGSIGEYHERVLEPIYRDLEPHDPERLLRHEWVNARGAIARFERMAIEIRVLDVQETPLMDVAYAALIVDVLKILCDERWADRRALDKWHTQELGALLELTARRGEGAGITERRYLGALGFKGSSTDVKGLWAHLIGVTAARGTLDAETERLLEHYLRHGSLASRIARAVGPVPARARIKRVYEEALRLARGRRTVRAAGAAALASPLPAVLTGNAMTVEHSLRNELITAIFVDFENLAIGVRGGQERAVRHPARAQAAARERAHRVQARLLRLEPLPGLHARVPQARLRDDRHPAARKITGKNSADIRMVVDAIDLCYSKSHIDTFALITGDSDFSPLVSKLKENDKRVLGCGVEARRRTCSSNNCDEFIFYDDLIRVQKTQQRQRRSARQVRAPTARSRKRSSACSRPWRRSRAITIPSGARR